MTTIIRETKGGLSTLVRQPQEEGDPKGVIIFLHGWGADGADLMDLAPVMARRFPHHIFASPDAPAPCSANPMGRQWFDLNQDQAGLDNGPDEAQGHIRDLIDELCRDHGVGLERVALIGFSQGGMMALHTGMRLSSPIAGIVSFSGALLAPDRLEREKTAAPPVLLVHGREDQVVPYQALTIAEAVLKQAEIKVTSVTRDGLGHGIDGEGLEAAMSFLGEIFPE
ncbi:alpha/beta hydrolase [Alphaproteobacteria bacterium LSUCC0684]